MMPPLLCVAMFLHWFPSIPYVSALWPTRDGCVPARLFMALWPQVSHLAAQHSVSVMSGTGSAISSAFAGAKDRAEVRRSVARLTDAAYPPDADDG